MSSRGISAVSESLRHRPRDPRRIGRFLAMLSDSREFWLPTGMLDVTRHNIAAAWSQSDANWGRRIAAKYPMEPISDEELLVFLGDERDGHA
jgi:hypothetical protein